ncbi:helix-turn-helix transcriptional regulator [Lysinibacillus sp. FSL K6-4013]|uniref:helix-turn-helix domain-containing protein n=1 Tax=Lysinibacillus sp. FSL K6-4013 TaxID=2921504 RepID=UPI00315B0580
MKAVKVFDEAFGEKLKRLRKSRGMSLQRLSDLSGCSPSYISRLERNEKQSPSFPILVALANALNVDVLTLAEGLVDKEEVVDLYSIMFKSPLRVADKVLSEEETMLVLQMIERIVEFEWSRESQWHELAELGEAINKLKNVK